MSIWSVTFCFSVLFKEHRINHYLGDPYILWAPLFLSLPIPHHKASASVIFQKSFTYPVIFGRLLCFLVATISPFFQPQPQALPTREWHQTTCQEPFKIAARHQWHSYSIWSTDVLKIWQKTTWCLPCQEVPVWWRLLVQICNINGSLTVF